MLPPQGCEAGTGNLGDGGRQTRHNDPSAEQTHGGWKRPLQGTEFVVFLRSYFFFFFFFHCFVHRMEFDKPRWSCSWNSYQTCTKTCQGHFVVYLKLGLFQIYGRSSLIPHLHTSACVCGVIVTNYRPQT